MCRVMALVVLVVLRFSNGFSIGERVCSGVMVLVVLVVLRFSTFLFLNRCACLLWDDGSRGSRGSSIFQCFLFLNRMCMFPLGWCC